MHAANQTDAERASERLWWLYTPVWGAVCGIVMVGGFAERWGDTALLTFGVVLALPAVLLPILSPTASPRSLPFAERAGVRLSLAVTAFSLLLNYTQTPFFFDVLHAHFGFHTSWRIRGNPVFLYLLTIPYFATYCVMLRLAERMVAHRLAGTSRWLRGLSTVVVCMLVAALEAVCNANPFTRHLYCFDDYTFALWFGSVAYGLAFVCILPVWRAASSLRPGHVLIGVCAAVYVDSLLLDVLRYHVAPGLTHVDEGAHAGPTCLQRP